MSDDLVKRARHNAQADMPHYASVGLIEEMADRIEELEGQLKTVLGRETSILRYYDAKLDAAEAKLAKAVRLMELSVELATWNTTLLDDVIYFIAELKGEQY